MVRRNTHLGLGTAILATLAGCATESQSNDATYGFGVAQNALVSRIEAESQSWGISLWRQHECQLDDDATQRQRHR
ncbi:MAG: hypothetical protein QM784_29800 [Polyangiaceae bacterium]